MISQTILKTESKIKSAYCALFILILFIIAPSVGRAQHDTLQVSTEALESARRDIMELERKDSLNTKLLLNLREQRNELQNIITQDSAIIAQKDSILSYKDQQMVIRNRQITILEQEVRYTRKRRWIFFGGGAAAAILGAIIIDQN